MESIYLAGDCFWCTEAIFKSLKGVTRVIPGYIGGETSEPTYNAVCSGHSGHAEAVECYFDEKIISLNDILEVFFATHDPTQLNRQGNDVGTQYRSAIFCKNNDQKAKVENFIKELQGNYEKPIVTEVTINNDFFHAENYHIDYYNKNKNVPYCQLVIKPKLYKFQQKYKKN